MLARLNRLRFKNLWGYALLSMGLFSMVSSIDIADGYERFFIGHKPLADCDSNSYAFKRPKDLRDCVGKEHIYSKAAVACESTICSQVGRDILKKGGHAVDGLIATLLCIGIQNPEAAGIGGSQLMTIYDRKEKQAYTLDGLVTAPKKAGDDLSQYNDNSNTNQGPKSIATPGAVAALKEAHDKFGRLPWADLFEPSIKMCEEGVPIDFATADALTYPDFSGNTLVDDIKHDAELRKLYLSKETGEPKEEGELVYYPKLAETYRRLAAYGGDDFYHGKLAKDIAEELAEVGGLITRKDLADYEAKWRKPAVDTVAGHRFYTTPPPSFGGLIPLYFRILEGFNMTEDDLNQGPGKQAIVYHRFLEAGKFIYTIRYFMADPDFYPDAMQNLTKIVTPENADRFRNLINDYKTHWDQGFYMNAIKEGMSLSTSHVSVVDEEGNAASATLTINLHMGSKVIGSRTGIIYNNIMADFLFPSKSGIEKYYPLPGKRVTSHMSPFVMVDEADDVIFVGGSSGATRITTTMAQVIANVFIFNKSLKDAVDDPRLYNLGIPGNNRTLVNQNFSNKKVLRLLADRGHEVYHYCYITSGFHGILVQDGKLHAYVDPAKFDCPAGY